MDRANLIKVYMDTIYKVTLGKFKTLKTADSVCYDGSKVREIKRIFDTKIEVTKEDTFVACMRLYLTDPNIVFLNFASAKRAGGGVETGCKCQEEELFRRSNYCVALKQNLYPLKRPNCNYSPDVWIIKDTKYEDLKEPIKIAGIAAAALSNPYLDDKNHFSKDDYIFTYSIIENVFKCAYYYGHTTLILGAIGLGVFRNSKSDIVDIFNKLLKQYKGVFKTIVFAVYDPKNDGNFELFDKYITK